jgi:hypothetical protein
LRFSRVYLIILFPFSFFSLFPPKKNKNKNAPKSKIVCKQWSLASFLNFLQWFTKTVIVVYGGVEFERIMEDKNGGKPTVETQPTTSNHDWRAEVTSNTRRKIFNLL